MAQEYYYKSQIKKWNVFVHVSKCASFALHCLSTSLMLLLSHCTWMYSSVGMCFDLLHLTVTPLLQPPPALACRLLLGVSFPPVRVGIHTPPASLLTPPSLVHTHIHIEVFSHLHFFFFFMILYITNLMSISKVIILKILVLFDLLALTMFHKLAPQILRAVNKRNCCHIYLPSLEPVQ